uniref:Uncharacterized protein n=1 Tax=Myotis myotis TaxID=51298 RepID=A0A7J7SC99_MYOMY|nr:hypothetical protein mMyoMyo1_009534 [Myotis myotis]
MLDQLCALLPIYQCNYYFFKYIFIDFLQGGRKRDRALETSMREKHQSAASCTPPTGNRACNQGTCPRPKLNPGPFSPRPNDLSTEPNRSGLNANYSGVGSVRPLDHIRPTKSFVLALPRH